MAAVFAASLAACGPGPVVETLRPGVQVGATPSDNSTGLTALSIELIGSGVTTLFDEVVASGKLATWPDLTPLPSHVFTPSPPSGGSGFTTLPRKSVVADETQPAGWYALLFDTLPPDVSLQDGAFHKLPDGRSVARVRVGSAPVLWGYAMCPKGDGRTAIVVRYSEPLHAATTSTPYFVKAGPPGQEKDCDGMAPLVGHDEADYEFLCGPLASTDQIVVDVHPGLLTASGLEVPAGQSTLPLNQVKPSSAVAGGCSSFKFDP